MFVELHFQRNPRVEDRDAGAAVVEQQVFEVVQDAFQDRQVDVFAIQVFVAAVAFVAGFEDHVDHRPERIQQIEEDVEHLLPADGGHQHRNLDAGVPVMIGVVAIAGPGTTCRS